LDFLSLVVSGEIKQLLVINHADPQSIQKADAPDDVDRKAFVRGEVDNRLPLRR
jgi:hypothetical protein